MCICRLEYKRPYYCYFGIRSCFFSILNIPFVCVSQLNWTIVVGRWYIHIIFIVFPHNMVIKLNLIFKKKFMIINRTKEKQHKKIIIHKITINWLIINWWKVDLEIEISSQNTIQKKIKFSISIITKDLTNQSRKIIKWSSSSSKAQRMIIDEKKMKTFLTIHKCDWFFFFVVNKICFSNSGEKKCIP